MESKWFSFMGGKFLVKSLDPVQILALRDQVDREEITQNEAMQELFKSSLIGFKDIEVGKKISRKEKIQALFRNPEIRNFVLWMAYNMLSAEADRMEKLRDVMEKLLLVTGNLKS
jgi:hypothetical protein